MPRSLRFYRDLLGLAEGRTSGAEVGWACGVRIEDIEDPLCSGSWMDKLTDELAKGRRAAKILRT